MYYPDDKYKNFLGTIQEILVGKDKFVEKMDKAEMLIKS